MKVTLWLGEDCNGQWGTMPLACYDPDDILFNVFWSGNGGIHHDVFEHYFELRHKYFLGDYGINVLGEIVAHGHMNYYANELQCSMRTAMNGDCLSEDIIIEGTLDYIQDNCGQGWSLYGDTLMSKIPYQKPGSVYTETLIEEYLKKLKEIRVHPTGEKYYNSCTPEKIRNAHRLGERMARKLCPDTNTNRRIMDDFIAYWDEFCKDHEAHSVARSYDRIIFDVHTKHKELVWNAWFRDNVSYKLVNYKQDLNIWE